MSAYTEFVKKHYASVSHLPHKERFGALAKMWAEAKGGKKPKGGIIVAGSLAGGKHKKTRGGIIVGGSEGKPSHVSVLDRDILGLEDFQI